jgi:alpha-ketoglutaric semialdehyde dehydrogenase
VATVEKLSPQSSDAFTVRAFENYINGKWVEARTKKTLENKNPTNIDETVRRLQASSPDDVEAACGAAVRAQSAWSQVPGPRRVEYLFKAAEILESRLDNLGEEMTREEGRTLPEAYAELKRAINITQNKKGV